LYKFIKEMGITVALDGQGADELMGGYYQYPFRKYLSDTLKKNGIDFYLNQATQLSRVHNKPVLNIFYNTMLSMLLEKGKEFSTYYYYNKLSPVKSWLNKDFFHEGLSQSHIINRTFYKKDLNFSSILKKESYELTKHTNLPGILRQVDRNSMAFSVEARLPFLDYRLVEFLYNLPSSFMIRDGFTKYAYRMAMKNIIPDEVLWRKTKIGFKMPEFDLLKINKAYILKSLATLNGGEYVDINHFHRQLDYILENKKHYNNIVWRIFCFAIWKSAFNLN